MRTWPSASMPSSTSSSASRLPTTACSTASRTRSQCDWTSETAITTGGFSQAPSTTAVREALLMPLSSSLRPRAVRSDEIPRLRREPLLGSLRLDGRGRCPTAWPGRRPRFRAAAGEGGSGRRTRPPARARRRLAVVESDSGCTYCAGSGARTAGTVPRGAGNARRETLAAASATSAPANTRYASRTRSVRSTPTSTTTPATIAPRIAYATVEVTTCLMSPPPALLRAPP